MNKNFIYGLVVGLGVLALFGFKSVVERPAPAAVTKWEYMSITTLGSSSIKKARIAICTPDGSCTEREIATDGNRNEELVLLNEFGKEGWELTTRNDGHYVSATTVEQRPMYLKRPIQE